MIKAILIKPLDGLPEGTEREFDKPDFDQLVGYGAVRAVEGDLRSDGPTVAEYVAAGYRATAYPPQGYASRSSAEEIALAVAAQDASNDAGGSEKAAPDVENKMAPAVENKAAPPTANKAAAKPASKVN